ncbi:MAG: hypothetical protein M1399_07360 [Actinobacteria bacterium]|nr:hypothetical protein [Actinomycetota bacterium]MCL5446654.1 hypothetical protein [Actinomycetota bacterium]
MVTPQDVKPVSIQSAFHPAPNPIPLLVHNLFHNYHPETVDQARDGKWVVLTVLAYGNMEQWRWMWQAYGRDFIEEVIDRDIHGLQTLPHPVANLWSLFLWGRKLPPRSMKEWWSTTRRFPPPDVLVEIK